ncbi:AGE family epimerase/isomerase [Bacillus sp. B1-b2]|uniref:AGE family epimerase/isomerase n=1 Tax=Bacillus sp. B1-b2 TaxID=2653201 RepID=UPI0012628C0A|nr:AGE family epimerase/isomerase [Bacillus sp. B1-b2]KAB7671772.1 N-acylglucosamine 2-epimerase [Bacillus sp. B1-b2]
MKRIEFVEELENRILPFWLNLIDRENGGFYGVVDYNLKLHPEAHKGGVLGARNLWTFSASYQYKQNPAYLEAAHIAFDFLKNKLWDHVHGGIYWLVDYKGEPVLPSKHVYAQSFALYGLSEYYKVTQDETVLELAKNVFSLIEEKCYSPEFGGYLEEFHADWTKKENFLLNEGADAYFTTNSHLHIIEAYTNLYQIWPDESLLDRINNLLDIFSTKIFNMEGQYCYVAFDQNWSNTKDTFSYGHDIETSWLLTEALEVTKLDRPDIVKINELMALQVSRDGLAEDGSIMDCKENGLVHSNRVWWGQAEAVIGFHNAYELTKVPNYLTYSENVWKYIKDHFHDTRDGGEWYSRIDAEGQIISSLRDEKYQTPENIVDSWKCPYHNARMCLEMMRRLED